MPSPTSLEELLSLTDALAAGAPVDDARLSSLLALQRGDARTLAERLVTLARERVTARQQLLQVARLAEVGLSTAELVHELKQPLAALSGYAQLLSEDPASEEAPGWRSEVVQQAQRMEAMVQRLRRLTRAPGEARSATSLNAAVREAAALFARLPGAVSLELELGEGLALARGDLPRLVQVFTNLIANARDAVESRGGGVIRVRTLSEAGRPVAVVSDEGIGIPPELRERIFDPFVTTKGERGTGLGLYICREILRECGGELTLSAAEPPAVTAFTLRLLSAAATEGEAPAKEPASTERPFIPEVERLARRILDEAARVPETRRVLVVDEDAAFRRVLRVLLAHEGSPEIVEADALDVAEQRLARERFDLLLCERLFSGGSGLELARRARALHPELELGLVSALPTTETAREALALGARDYLTKPLEDVAALRALLAFAARQSRLRRVAARLSEQLGSWAEALHDALRLVPHRLPGVEDAVRRYLGLDAAERARVAVLGRGPVEELVAQAGFRPEVFESASAFGPALLEETYALVVAGPSVGIDEVVALARRAASSARAAEIVWAGGDAPFDPVRQLLRAGVGEPLSQDGARAAQQLTKALARRRDRVKLHALSTLLEELGA